MSSEALQELLEDGDSVASWRRSGARGKRVHASVHVCPQTSHEASASPLGKGELASLRSSSCGLGRSKLTWSLGQDNSDTRSGLLTFDTASRQKESCGVCGGDKVELHMAGGELANGEVQLKGSLKVSGGEQ